MDKFIGLTHSAVVQKLHEHGYNEITELNHVSPSDILLRQIKNNFVIYLLFASVIISLLVGKDLTAYIILAVIALVIVVGFFQEYKAEKAIQALKDMVVPVSIVIRDGKEKEVPSREIVPGDVVILRAGEKIPADCIILDANDLRTNESILTGEAEEIEKRAIKGDTNYKDEQMLFMSTFIVNGRSIAQVLHTGMNTRFGSIAGMISKAEKELPLQDKINSISKYMVVIAITMSVVTGIMMIARAPILNTDALINILILVIALSVAAFPEGFPVVLITTLAAGASRMAKQNAIVNRISIIEALGETTVICSDKTGTLTKGEMTVRSLFINNTIVEIKGVGYEAKGQFLFNNKEIANTPSLEMLLKTAILCNDSRIERTGEDQLYSVNGSATEGSLLILAAKKNLFKEDLGATREEEIPFSPERKMMSVLCKDKSNHLTIYAKGAPEYMLKHCRSIQINGKIIALTAQKKQEILTINKDMNGNSLRTLALAYKKEDKVSKNYSEDNLIFLGLVAIEDPPREEVAAAIQMCTQAGINVKMITGDHKETAVAIGKEIGLVGNVIEGEEIDQLSDEELQQTVKETVIFARVRPEHKLRIVKALKQNGEIVTMTGDGVNDAPSLKEAHIGVAMGKNGTDVSRSVADITLKDDNFATIVVAIKEGRTIFNNIRKFATYQLSCNLAELSILFFGVLLAPLFGWQVPILLALHILFMNLITDNLPAITLGFNPSSKDIMMDMPRRKENILTDKLKQVVIFNALLMGASTLFAYFIMFNIIGESVETARTCALVTLILLEIFSAFSFRSFRYGVFNRGIFVNMYLLIASLISISITLAVVYSPLNIIFETTPLTFSHWLISILIALFPVVLFDLLKIINNASKKAYTSI